MIRNVKIHNEKNEDCEDKKMYLLRRNMSGTIMVSLSSIFYGIIPLFVKMLQARGMSVTCCMTYRFAMIAAASVLLSKLRNYSLRVSWRQLVELMVFGILAYGMTNLLLGTSYLYMDMGLATVCHFVYPVVVVVIMRGLFGEKLDARKLVAVGLTILGLACLALGGGSGSIKGILIAVSSGMAYGIYVISLEKASFHDLEKPVIVSYVTLGCTVFYTIKGLLRQEMRLPEGLTEWGFLFVASCMGMMAMVLLADGVKILGASKASFINMLEPLSNIVIDFLYYGTIPFISEGIGSMLILSAIGAISLPSDRKEGA